VGVSDIEAVFAMETGGQPQRRSFSLSTTFLKISGEAMVLVCLEDITERKLAETSLKEAHQDLKSLIDASPAAILAVDLHKNITAWNPAAEQMFGWSKQEVLGRPTPIVPAGKDTELEMIFEKMLKGETFRSFETRRMKKDGTLVDVSLSTAALFTAGGQFKGSMAILEDILERKRVENEREQLLKQLGVGRKRLRDLLRRLVELQETERRELSRELHDEVGQNLTALSINLNIIQNLLRKVLTRRSTTG